MKAISKKHTKLICNRCGNKTQELFGKTPCSICGGCYYCLKCNWLGKKTMCDVLNDVTLKNNYEKVDIKVDIRFTKLQENASNYLVRNLYQSKDILLWAVCGAGKTEIVYEVINKVLNNKGIVCFAIPRVDVVKEIKTRLKKTFTCSVTSLYGGSKDEIGNSVLIVATTHQTLKFQRTFDLIIVDESDAFPYSMDESLQYGIKRSLKVNGKIIYLTATPNNQLKKAVSKGEIKQFIIPARYHGYKLDLPEFIHDKGWTNNVPRFLNNYISKINNPTLIYLPSIYLLKKYSKELNIPYVYSKLENRSNYIKKFKNGEIKYLLTSTILERGITIKGLDVIVVGSEHKVFSKNNLVQIAGRVGRKMDHPHGRIIFISSIVTLDMIKARNYIKYMNKLAKKMGYLK